MSFAGGWQHGRALGRDNSIQNHLHIWAGAVVRKSLANAKQPVTRSYNIGPDEWAVAINPITHHPNLQLKHHGRTDGRTDGRMDEASQNSRYSKSKDIISDQRMTDKPISKAAYYGTRTRPGIGHHRPPLQRA